MAQHRTTLADVAREAGTSTAVVSYVINNGPRPVSQANRERVLAAVERLGYRPNRVARALRRQRTGTLGLLTPNVTLPFFGSLERAVESRTLQSDLLLITGNSDFQVERELKTLQAFIDAGVDGLLIVSESASSEVDDLVSGARVPTVWMHYRDTDSEGAIVMANHLEAGTHAASHLVEAHDCRELAFIGGPNAHGTVASRQRGAMAAAPGIRVVLTDLSPQSAYSGTRAMLAAGPPPDGVVVGTFGQATAVVAAIVDEGLRVGDDLKLVTFDEDENNRFSRPTLAAVVQDVTAMANLAVQWVTEPDGAPPISRDQPTRLITAQSCGCHQS